MIAPPVSILIANCNGRQHLEACLPSLRALDYPHDRVEVVLVDNGSTDDSVEWVRRAHPDTRVVRFDRNLGFAPAYNRAVDQVEAERLVFLNNDTRVDPGWLAALVATADRHDAAAVGSVMLDWHGRQIDFGGGVLSMVGHAWSDRAGRPAAEAPAADEPLLFACAGSMLVARSAFRAAGGFDEDYFAYFEDVDLGWRLSLAGHRVMLASRAVTYHRGHGTAGRWAFSPRLRLYERNALFSIYKNYEDETLRAVLPAALALTLARGLRYSSLPADRFEFGRPLPREVTVARQTVATLLAIEEFGAALPALADKRARVQRSRRMTDRDLWPLFRDPLRLHGFGEPYESIARAVFDTFGCTALPRPAGWPRHDAVAPAGDDGTSPLRPAWADCPGEPTESAASGAVPRCPVRADVQGPPGGEGRNGGGEDPPPGSRLLSADRGVPDKPLVSVIVLTALGPRHLPECLDSLTAQRYAADCLEVLVVDNGSAVDPTPVVQRHCPAARVLRLGANTGFCAGNNAGAREARGAWLFFLNDDTRADPACVEALVDAATRRGAAGVGAQVLNWNGTRIDFAGGGMNFYGKGFQTGVGSTGPARQDRERPLLFACGAALLVDRVAFLDAGGFDEELFAYYEDLALGWRFWLGGREVWFAPAAVVYHRHHGTSGQWPRPPAVRCYERNALITIFKHYEDEVLRRVMPAATILAVERALIQMRLAGVEHEPRRAPTSALRRLAWRLQPGALARQVRADLATRGASRQRGVAGSLRRVGPRGLVRSAIELARFVGRDQLAHLDRRWAYAIERGVQERGFDAQAEPVTPESGAVLTALDEFVRRLPRLAGARAGIQAGRRTRDAAIFTRFADHWLDPAVTGQQRDYEALERTVAATLGIDRLWHAGPAGTRGSPP